MINMRNVGSFTLILSAAAFYASQMEPAHVQPSIRLPVREIPIAWTGWKATQLPSEGTDQLLALMKPKVEATGASLGLHYLYFWGPNHKVEVGGKDVSLLKAFQMGCFGGSENQFFFRGSDGVVRANSEPLHGEAHPGQILSYFGDMQMAKTERLGTAMAAFSIEEAVRSTAANFSLIGEFEWQLSTLLHYIPPSQSWENRWGEKFDFDKCAATVVGRAHGVGPCSGTHALAVASAMLRVNQEYEILSLDSRSQLEQYLQSASSLLHQNQCSDGGWNGDWFATEPPHRLRQCTIQVTGHQLEWILDAPIHVRPSTDVVSHAVMACRIRMLNATPQDCQENICAFTHAIKSVFYYQQIAHDK